MKYEITAIANGHEIKRLVNVDEHETDEQVITRFVSEWVQYGDSAPSNICITQRWSVR